MSEAWVLLSLEAGLGLGRVQTLGVGLQVFVQVVHEGVTWSEGQAGERLLLVVGPGGE